MRLLAPAADAGVVPHAHPAGAVAGVSLTHLVALPAGAQACSRA